MPAGVKHHWSLFNSVHKAYHAAFSGCSQRAGKKLGQHEFHMTLTKYKKDVCVCSGGLGRVERKISKSGIICSVVENAIGCLHHKTECVCVCNPDSSISETLCSRKTELVYDQSRHLVSFTNKDTC